VVATNVSTLHSPNVPTHWQLFLCRSSIPRHSQERWTFVALTCLLYFRIEAKLKATFMIEPTAFNNYFSRFKTVRV
jgi:hypothetical protein